MSTLWTITLHPNQEIELKVERPLKISNASLGVNVSDGDAGARTVISLRVVDDAALPSEASPPVYTAICSLTGVKDHVSLDIVLSKGTCIKLKADGPNDAYLIGYYLSPIEACTVSQPAVSVASVSAFKIKKHKPVEATTSSGDTSSGSVASSTVSASGKQRPVKAPTSNTNSSSTGITETRAVAVNAHIAEVTRHAPKVKAAGNAPKVKSFQTKDIEVGKGNEARDCSEVEVNVKATYGDDHRDLFHTEALPLILDDKQDMYAWKRCVIGMRADGRRLIKVPAHWARGDAEKAIKSDFTVDVTLVTSFHEDYDL
ncbi:hypothetical protein B0H11DRAFT_2221237 [Mycena galericulata]|nr:hypothetical protein B0H11DRAFT_2221237 [Mycena galericulata]